MAGKPIKNLFPDGLCGAKTRKGTPCKIRLEVRKCKNGNFRCKYHGGMSTGPKTPEGMARTIAALRAGWKRWHDAGRPAKRIAEAIPHSLRPEYQTALDRDLAARNLLTTLRGAAR